MALGPDCFAVPPSSPSFERSFLDGMIAEVTICPDPRCNLSKKIARCSPAALWAMQTQPSLFSLQLSAVQCVQALSDKIIGQVSPDVIRAWVDGDQVLQHSALPSTPAPSLPPRADGSRRRARFRRSS